MQTCVLGHKKSARNNSAAPPPGRKKKKRVPQGNALFFRNSAELLVHIEHFGAVDWSKLAIGWQDAGIAH